MKKHKCNGCGKNSEISHTAGYTFLCSNCYDKLSEKFKSFFEPVNKKQQATNGTIFIDDPENGINGWF